jgi:hypothetical protein
MVADDDVKEASICPPVPLPEKRAGTSPDTACRVHTFSSHPLHHHRARSLALSSSLSSSLSPSLSLPRSLPRSHSLDLSLALSLAYTTDNLNRRRETVSRTL